MFVFSQPLSRGHAAFRGILALVMGAICVIWPGITIGVIVALFAIYCFTDAVIQLMHAFRSGETAGHRVLMVLMTVIDVAAGVIALSYPGMTASVLVILVGIWAIVGGFTEIMAASQLPGGSGSGWLVVGGLLSIAAGIVLMAWPGIGAVSLSLILGIYLIVYGTTLIVSAIATPSGETVDAIA